MIRRVAVVTNGRAGALLDGSHAGTLQGIFTAAGLDPVFVPQDAGTLPERMRLAAASAVDAVVVAGGDGTVACAALAMAGRELPLAILAFGTMNLLAKDLGLPIADPAASVAAIGQGHIRCIDVGEVNGHVFLCASMLGLPARLGRTREQTRGGGVTMVLRMASAVWRQLVRAKPLRVTLTADGQPAPLRAAAITITLNPMDPASGRTFGRSALDGGQLAIYAVERLGLRTVLGLAARLLFGRRHPVVREQVANTVDIASRRSSVEVMNDGELVRLASPLRYRLRPGALRVIVPAA